MRIITLGALFLMALIPGQVHAMGAKPVTPTPPPVNSVPTPVSQQAKPYRTMELTPVTVPSFFLPNGQRADYNIDLNALITTQINAGRWIRTQAADPANPSRLLISGGITSFEADVEGADVKIGWSPGGATLIPGQTVNGEVTLKVSSLSMDLLIYDRVQNATRISASTNQDLSALNITAVVDMSNYEGSVNLVYQQLVSKAVAVATANVVKALEDRPEFDTLFWQMPVAGLDASANFVGFNAGASNNVQVGDVYSLYSACDATAEANGTCFSRFLSDVRVYQVGQTTAQAKPLTASDSLSAVQLGDRVEVKALGAAATSSLSRK